MSDDLREKLEEIHGEVKDMRRENIESHNSIKWLLTSMRDNMHHYYESIRAHILAFITWNKGD